MVVHGLSQGKYLTAKHTLFPDVLHSLASQKIPTDFISTFGNCGNYSLVQLIEISQTELVQKMRQEGFPLPIVPENDQKPVTTHFW